MGVTSTTVCKKKNSPYGQTCDLVGEVKKSNIIKCQLQSQFQRYLYQTLCVVLQIKDRKHIERNFHSVAWVIMPKSWD